MDMPTVTGNPILDFIISIGGTVFSGILIVRMIGYWARNEYGEWFACGAGALVVIAFLYFPTQTIGALKAIVQKLPWFNGSEAEASAVALNMAAAAAHSGAGQVAAAALGVPL